MIPLIIYCFTAVNPKSMGAISKNNGQKLSKDSARSIDAYKTAKNLYDNAVKL
ncbi:hypothetical protein GCM10009092_39500 [Bowmanella denitrificans]|uniref:Uncharacterized protein n=1 Tax=Bowmanella denitrificans TaxID=366582 RepID=A0ABN0XRX9_9ALTE